MVDRMILVGVFQNFDPPANCLVTVGPRVPPLQAHRPVGLFVFGVGLGHFGPRLGRGCLFEPVFGSSRADRQISTKGKISFLARVSG